MFCANCGVKNNEDAGFCASCGIAMGKAVSGGQSNAPPPVYPAVAQPYAPPQAHPPVAQPYAPPPAYPADEQHMENPANKSMIRDSFAAIGRMFTGDPESAIDIAKNTSAHIWIFLGVLNAVITALGVRLFFTNIISRLAVTNALERQIVGIARDLSETVLFADFAPDYFLGLTREFLLVIEMIIEDIQLWSVIWIVTAAVAGFFVTVICAKLLYAICKAKVSLKATANTVAASLLVPGIIAVIAIIVGFASLIASIVIAAFAMFAYYIMLYGAVKKAGNLTTGPIWGFLLIIIVVTVAQLAVIFVAAPSVLGAIDFYPLSVFLEIDYFDLTSFLR